MTTSWQETFGVVMTIVERADQVEWAVQRLRRVYESEPFTLISDGHEDARYEKIAEAYGGRYLPGKKLKTPREGAHWWERIFQAGLAMRTRYTIKIDADTSFNRPIEQWPEFDCFGTVTCRGSEREHIQGGVQAFRRSAIEAIVASRICLRSEFREVKYWAWDEKCAAAWEKQGYLCTDQVLRRILIDTGLTWGDWPEVKSWYQNTPDDPERFTITHAHKWMNLAHRLT